MMPIPDTKAYPLLSALYFQPMNTSDLSFFENIHAIDLTSLADYFSENRIESQNLEFKSGEATIDKILKEVAALLNTQGGVLIIGAPRELDRAGNQPGTCRGPLTFSSFESVETLKTYLSHDIVPPPPRLELAQLKDAEHNVFLVKIPPSPMGPHQVLGNGKYYIRDGDKSRPATHREVEKMFVNRLRGNLDLQLSITKEKDYIKVSITIHNLSSNAAENTILRIKARPILGHKILEREYPCPEDFLHHRHSWVEEISIPYARETIYLQADVWGRGLITKTKAAFIAITHSRTELLATYYSEEINAPQVSHFFDSNRYLLD